MQNFTFPHQSLHDEIASFIIDENHVNPFKPQFRLPQTTQITLEKDFDLLRKKVSRKTCNLKFDPYPTLHRKITMIFNKLPKLDISELKISLQPRALQEYMRVMIKSFLKNLENLKKLPNLSKLHLDLSFENSNLHSFIEPFCESLKRLARLTHLYITLQSNDLIEHKIVIFMSGFKYFKSLRFFELSLIHTEKLSTRGVNELCKSLGYLQKLRGLSLDFSCCEQLNDDTIEKLFESIKTIPNLSSLSLSLRRLPKLTINGIYILLSFLNSDQEPDVRDDYQIIFSKYLEASPLKLSHLHLNLSSLIKIPKRFGTNLTPYHGLTALDLDLSANKYLHAGEIMEICFCLGYLKDLSKLSLNLSSNPKVRDEAVICLARAIRPLWLVELDLNFGGCRRVLPNSWKILLQAIGASIDLNKLNLNCSETYGVDGKVLEQLGFSTNRMKNLRFLCLEFWLCSLDDSCLEEIAILLKNLRNLQRLNLGLENNPSLTSGGFNKISLVLNEAGSLRKLSLNLDSFHPERIWSWPIESLKLKVTEWNETDFRAFSSRLSELSQLKSLYLWNSCGYNISPLAIIEFAQKVRSLKNVDFSGCIDSNHTLDNNSSFWINYEIKEFLTESNESISAQYKEALNRKRQENLDERQKKRWSFTLCGVTIW